MTTLTGYDASTPPAHPPAADVVAFYGGGDTPHVWTVAEIEAQAPRYRLPIWVRSSTAGHFAGADAAAFKLWLAAVGAPPECLVAFDLETAIAPGYVASFGALMAPRPVLVYGSSDNLFHNPAQAGYWVAEPGRAEIPANCAGLQYGTALGVDLDLFIGALASSLWDSRPVPPPPPPPPPEEEAMGKLTISEDGNTIADVRDDGHLIVFTAPWAEASVIDLTDRAQGVDAAGGPWLFPTS